MSPFTYVYGRLLLVSGEHPDLDVGPHQSGDGLWHAGLQAVLYRRGAQQHEVLQTERKERYRAEVQFQRNVNKQPDDNV